MKIWNSEKRDGFFSRLDWLAFWSATIIVFVVYFLTLGPSVGLEDSGELATAGAHLGVPHPPGYPFWTLCSWIFCKIFSFVTYMGHPSPAWAISCFSAVAGALAAGCTAMLICRSATDFISEEEGIPGKASCDISPIIAFGGGVGGALTFALSPVEWSQSTIVEIYSLNALFLMLVFLLSYRWMRKPSDKILWMTAFVFGLGLTNYQVLLFAIVPLAIIILMKNLSMFRDVFIYLLPVAMTYQILQIGQLMKADRYMQGDVIAKHAALEKVASAPSSTAVAIALAIVVVSLVCAAAFRDKARDKAQKFALYGCGAGAVMLFLAATLFTGKAEWSGVDLAVAPLIEPTRYAMIAAAIVASIAAAVFAALQKEDLTFADKNYKNPIVVSIVFALIAIFLAASVATPSLDGYTGPAYPWAKSTTIFIAVLATFIVLCSFVKRGLCFIIPVAGLQIAAFFLLKNGALNGLTHPASWYFAWPIAWNFILLGLVWILLPNGKPVAGAAFFAQLGVSFYAYMPIVSDLRNPPMNWGYPRTWEGFKHAIQRGQYEAIGFPSFPSIGAFFSFFFTQMGHYFRDVITQFTDWLVPFALLPFVLAKRVVKSHKKIFWQWMSAAAICFMMMSGLLILLAQVKGDVQDGFIQKVKFISSHAMIALWIGYGLVFALWWLVKMAKRPVAKGAAIAIAAATIGVCALCPIIQNYTDERMVFELGGCEQNNHTFGWQFGAYQLNGAEAIKEQLTEDEEPLPDPSYPPRMDDFAIFFGGTDPGRFVPTYMIYSAEYRPDVYLITQNALADDTYMSVERDLYGDEIWIPSKEDSSEAFNIYVDEVQRGIRPANGDLQIMNGRVQVTGALGVMEINGILTEMMFKHERNRHAFYVEESYVIPWMYPYMTPHGLIMKINPEKTRIDPKLVRQDADFWDWYMRRLLNDPMYRRDFAGQKSFSKLRAALAGLLLKQGKYSCAVQAYAESVMLYPASPEATFRYVQEILMPRQEWDKVVDILDYTDEVDPNNARTKNIRTYVARVSHAYKEIAKLNDKLKTSKSLNLSEYYQLAQLYYSIGSLGNAATIARKCLPMASGAEEFQLIATLLFEANMAQDAEQALSKLLALDPKNADAYMKLAKLQYRSSRRKMALETIKAAIQADRKTSQDLIMRDKELQQIAAPLFRQ